MIHTVMSIAFAGQQASLGLYQCPRWLVGEQLGLSGSITSITLTDSGGVINVVSDNERYGKTWLTYNLKLSNPAGTDQGSFQGRATAINDG